MPFKDIFMFNTMPSSSLWQRFSTRLLKLQKQVHEKLTRVSAKTAEDIARSIDADPEDVFHMLRHFASNDPHVRVSHGDEPADDQYTSAE